MAFFEFPLADQARMIRSIETGVRTLPAPQLETETDALRERAKDNSGLALGLVLKIYEAERLRRAGPW
jgi:hypothetical protein